LQAVARYDIRHAATSAVNPRRQRTVRGAREPTAGKDMS
jgi:hypothetical protein